MKWRSELVVTASLVALLMPSAVLAQSSSPDPACACHAEPDTSTTPGGTPHRTMLLLGAAGLAVLSGLPFGGTSMQGLPFAAGAAQPSNIDLAEAAGVPAPARPGEEAVLPVVPVPKPFQARTVPELAAVGLIPPKTATHLPLLAACGLLMVASGGLLARRGARERRRKRRFVAL